MDQAEQSKQQISVGYIRNLSEFYGPRMIFIEGMIIITLILGFSYESFHEMNLSVIVCSKPFDKLLIIPLLLLNSICYHRFTDVSSLNYTAACFKFVPITNISLHEKKFTTKPFSYSNFFVQKTSLYSDEIKMGGVKF